MSFNPLPVPTSTVIVTGINTTPVEVYNPLQVSFAPTATDAFGRHRVSTPLTLFDSSHRYRDNGQWATFIVGSGSTVGFVTHQGLIDMTVGVGTAAVTRETLKVFPYQPGKSLQILNTLVMNSPKNNLRQRVGYFGESNGIYFECTGTTLNFVERSSVTGIISETRVPQSQWSEDSLDGNGLSGYVIDVSKGHILWIDIEWLGLGTVRVGFVIDGKFIHCHSFQHANKITSTYITTASLPIRYEIENLGITTSSSTLKQVCSTVISEGGYELRGLQQTTGTGITSPIGITTSNAYFNLISIRLKSNPDRLDAVVILTALSIMGNTNNTNYNWQVRANGVSVGGTWVSAGADSAVEYKLDGGIYTGGRVLASGFFNSSQQNTQPVNILKEALFKFQLERDGLTKTPHELSLVCSSDNNTVNGSHVFASLDWEEISR